MRMRPEHWVFAVNAAQMLVDGKTTEYVKASMRALDFDNEQGDELFTEAFMICIDLKGGLVPTKPDWAK